MRIGRRGRIAPGLSSPGLRGARLLSERLLSQSDRWRYETAFGFHITQQCDL